jgi:hypothetical protein
MEALQQTTQSACAANSVGATEERRRTLHQFANTLVRLLELSAIASTAAAMDANGTWKTLSSKSCHDQECFSRVVQLFCSAAEQSLSLLAAINRQASWSASDALQLTSCHIGWTVHIKRTEVQQSAHSHCRPLARRGTRPQAFQKRSDSVMR